MSELTLTVLRLGFVVLLWVFVISVVGVLRRDLFGTKVVPRSSPRRPAPARPVSVGRTPAGPAAGSVGQPGRTQQSPAVQVPDRTAPAKLVVTEGSLRGTTLTLGQAPVLIGRAPECTLVLTDDYASGRHARLFPQAGRWFVEDLGSTNGTQIGHAKVTQPVPVEVGQQLRIGRTVLELRR
jgi:Inner membrane component of T3SS, cytoplasmic domain